jgi:hypothetical protein
MRLALLVPLTMAIATALTACPSRSSSNGGSTVSTQPGANAARSRPLTAPWKDMKLSIDGGVVVVSDEDTLLVRFPATPPDVTMGLAEVLKGELVDSGWVVVEEIRDPNDYEGVFKTPNGKDAGLRVNLFEGRPKARFTIR